MKTKMTILAALFGFAMLAAPAVASAHPAPAWRRAEIAQHFENLGPRERYMFLQQHPYLARHRWELSQPYAYRNGYVAPHYFRF
jgi:hypothetical protein